MQFLRMVKSELRRLFSDKKTLIIFFAVLAVLIALVTLYIFSFEMSPDEPKAPEDFNVLMERYRENYEYYRSWYLYEIGEGPRPESDYPAMWEEPKERMHYYEFMLKQTAWHPYMDVPGDITFDSDSYAYRGLDAAFLILRLSFYPLVFFSAVAAVLTCISPYEKGIMKNYCASPTNKRTIMGGKLFSLGLINFTVWFIILVWELCFGASNADVYITFYDGVRYNAQPLLTVIFSAMLGTLFAMLFVSCFTVFIGQFVKKSLPTAFIGMGITLLSLALCALVFSSDIIDTIMYLELHESKYFPVISLWYLCYNLADYRMWVALAFHIVVGAVMVYLTLRQQTVRELHTRIKRKAKE